jgi:hypothetical protein
MRIQDSFQISGPNGTHECLVLELLGPSVADILDADSRIERLPGTLARTIAKQTLLGLCILHEQEITHAGILTCQYINPVSCPSSTPPSRPTALIFQKTTLSPSTLPLLPRIRQKSKKTSKTYNSGYSPVVTHLTTNPPVHCLSTAERTGSSIFNVLWSYVEDRLL